MTYDSVEIAQLCHPQELKLKKGHHVRIKVGNYHAIHVSSEQFKNYMQHTKRKSLYFNNREIGLERNCKSLM